jgi:hypothetical protein
MPSPAVKIEAAGRTLRVSNPDRVIVSRDRPDPAVTKLDVLSTA